MYFQKEQFRIGAFHQHANSFVKPGIFHLRLAVQNDAALLLASFMQFNWTSKHLGVRIGARKKFDDGKVSVKAVTDLKGNLRLAIKAKLNENLKAGIRSEIHAMNFKNGILSSPNVGFSFKFDI